MLLSWGNNGSKPLDNHLDCKMFAVPLGYNHSLEEYGLLNELLQIKLIKLTFYYLFSKKHTFRGFCICR